MSSGNDWQVSWSYKKALEGIEGLKAAVDEDRKKAEAMSAAPSLGGPKPLQDYKCWAPNRPTSYSTPEAAQKAFDKMHAECKRVAEKNKPIIEHNQKVFNAAVQFLQSLGLQKTEHYYKTSRSKTQSDREAPWLSSLKAHMALSDARWKSIQGSYCSLKDEVSRWAKKLHEDNVKQKREEEKNKDVMARQRALGVLAVKYDCESFASEHDIMDHILGGNKYLRLAHYLQLNRGDWSDGHSYAETGLQGFEATTSVDHEIVDEISGFIADWDGDGRVFRDCTWNYGKLFEMARELNATLVDDYVAMLELMPSYV